MRRITTSQIVALCVCVVYLLFSTLRIGARAMMGFFRLGSEYPEVHVPKEALMNVANIATQVFREDTLLVGIGFVMLASVVFWIGGNPRVKTKSTPNP